ncbi:MAG: DNA repair protein rad16 [Alectoria fallacina]|uniref:DNA repair protein rad16 n=1 Tax=Alectoria fallacina TaxID=1903189 RepID=A0A8H3I4L2_9LECA|nr:MAG: DNA repair protein rad16 [Alectoria fallacina]
MARKVAAARAFASKPPSLPVNTESPSPRRKAGRPSYQSKLRVSKATDFGDMGLDEEPSSAKEKTTQLPQQSLRKVVIPVKGRSSIASSLSSVRDQSSEYDTPGTSVVVTPAESLVKEERPSKPPSRISSSIPSCQHEKPFKGKRKRLEVDELMEADACLARKLQEQEYGEDQELAHRPRRSRLGLIEDSEDESLLSDFSHEHSPNPNNFPELNLLSSGRRNKRGHKALLSQAAPAGVEGDRSQEEFLDEDEVSEIPMPRNKRVKTNHRTSLPSRAARDSANKSIKDKISRKILDSEDSDMSDHSDDLSLFGSNIGSDASEDSEDADEEADGVVRAMNRTAVTANNSLSASTAAPATGRRGRRGATNPARGRRSWQRRVEDRAIRERQKLEKAHPEIITMWTDLESVPMIKPMQAMQPDTITRRLKSFQLEGLDWMTKQEKSQWKGGLLGDEMGMGKTIQAVSLIMSDYPAKDPTLVVVPPVALMQWQNEINEYTDGKLRVLIYHNSNPKVKDLKVKDLRSFDVIMISYSGLESVYRKESKGWKRDDGLIKENSKIHAINYHRLILDEAHNIKTRTTGVAKACFALKADHKWCLSGTPVQNRIGEFFSLLRFLQITPFACYFCKKCKCAELHWTQDEAKKCTTCNHTGFDHVSIFNQELLNPITQGEDHELRRAALGKLRLVTDRIMLRRMKRDHTASMELPPKEVIIHNEFFGEIERDFSSSIMSNTTRQFDTYVSRGVMLNNYANIFGLIMQMRQVANHPDLILKKHAQSGQNVLVCSICDETAEEPIRSRCHHEFCRKCAKDYSRSFEDETPDCPRCHIPLTIDWDQPDIEQDEDNVKKSSIINRIKMEDWTSSTKIEMLVYDLYKLRSRKQTHKSIVFSQFTSMLQLVEWRLRRAGFNTVMLDGSMSPAQRQKSIEYFMNNTEVEVFLVSLKAGGVALNLTEASRVFIIDPWWNPAAEWQSADRCHRIGQKRPCVITRLCIEDSVESRMVMLQEKKANMINGTINNDQVAMEKLTPEDMQFLFRGS